MTATSTDITALLDTLLPGGEGYPSASEAGLATRRVDGPDMMAALSPILSLAGPGFADKDESDRQATLTRLEGEHPEQFHALLTAAYTIYYCSPAVLSVIAATTGYRHPPQPSGYSLPPFDDSILSTARNNPVSWRRPHPPEA